MESASAKEAGEVGERLRKTASGKCVFQEDSLEKARRPGRVVSRNGSSSEEDSMDGSFGNLVKHGRRLRRERATHTASPEQPIVVVAPNRLPNTPGEDVPQPEVEELQGAGGVHGYAKELRAELRQMKKLDESGRSGHTIAALETPAPGGSATAVAALARLPTPPMDTTEPVAKGRKMHGSDGHARKRTHAPPKSASGDAPVPAALRAPTPGDASVPAALQHASVGSAGVRKAQRLPPVDDVALPAALRGDAPPLTRKSKRR